MVRWLGHIPSPSSLVGCFCYAVVITYQKLWTPVTWCQDHGRPRLIDTLEEQKQARLVWSYRRATVAQITERKLSEQCHQTLSTTESTYSMWTSKLDHVAMEEGCLDWGIAFSFRSGGWLLGESVCRLSEEDMAAGCTGKKAGRRRQCYALGNVLLGDLGSWHSCGCYFDTYHLPKHCCRPRTPFHGSGVPWRQCPLSAECTCHTAKTVQEWFEEHDNEFKVLLWPPNSPESDWVSIGCAGPTNPIHRVPTSQLARLKGIAPPKMKILSLITHFHAIPNLQDLHSSLEHKLRYFWWNLRAFWPCIDSNATDTFKAQKGSKDIVQIVHVTSVVQP